MVLLHANIASHDALRTLEEARRASVVPIDSLVPTYRSAIRSLGKEGKWRHALNLLKQLREEDDGPADTGCYGEAMNACRRAGAWKVALRLHTDLRAAGVPPEPFTASNAISACAPAGLWPRPSLRLA